eukprot:2764952-Karenia_brevis.AAC.1
MRVASTAEPREKKAIRAKIIDSDKRILKSAGDQKKVIDHNEQSGLQIRAQWINSHVCFFIVFYIEFGHQDKNIKRKR